MSPGDTGLSPLDVRRAWKNLVRRRSEFTEPTVHRVAVAGTFTVDPIIAHLGVAMNESGIEFPDIAVGPYDQLLQICYDWQSALDTNPDSIVLLWRLEDFLRPDLLAFLRGEEDALHSARSKVLELAQGVHYLRADFSGTIVVSTPPFPQGPDCDLRQLGSIDRGGRFHRDLLDNWIRALDGADVQMLNVEGLQRFAGAAQVVDARTWYLYRQPWSELFWSLTGVAAAQLIASRVLAPKKCVVVDCDNTLWGGVVGEDGVAGIRIGDDFPGSAFRDFQSQLLTLKAEGVLLAICSKNNEQDVWDVFDNHSGMALGRGDVAAWRVNWTDKPSNIISLAHELNIGLDSMVFVDDSAMEIAHVSEALPAVRTIHVPQDVTSFPGIFGAYRGFDRDDVTAEDRQRTDMIAQERGRRSVSERAVSKEDFIRSLEMTVEVRPAGPDSIERATQLINKSNQFNLTTRRRDLAQVSELIGDPSWIVVTMNASDRFGDYGLVGVAIASLEGPTASIDTLLMSCRVLGRNVEDAFLAGIGAAASEVGATSLRGSFVRSAKNQMVAKFFPDHGFAPESDGTWSMAIEEMKPWPSHVRGGWSSTDGHESLTTA